MTRFTLWQRLALVFAALLLICFAVTVWLQMTQHARSAQQIEQRLLRGLAEHIAAEAKAMDPQGFDMKKLAALVQRLRVSNPGIELYVLDAEGRIEMRYPDLSEVRRNAVNLAPVKDFLEGKRAPVLGDDPLKPQGRKIFSAAPFPHGNKNSGYLYAVLQGSAYDVAVAANGGNALAVSLWAFGVVTALALMAGLAAFALVTRPLSELTREIEQIEYQGRKGNSHDIAGALTPSLERGATEPAASAVSGMRDEIAILRAAFSRLVATNARQWSRLSQQDTQRRELVASISHDLRTPLASLHGYLETLLLKSPQLSVDERNRFLRTALSQSQRVGKLAEELLDLARLELGTVRPTLERFSLVDLTLDVIQKLALAASSRRQQISPDVAPDLPDVMADIGMIERVMTNLLDNAIRHSPEGGTIVLRLVRDGERVVVEVIDSGPGIERERRGQLFVRPGERQPGHEASGLGLAIVRQIMRLHGDDVHVVDRAGCGAVFVFGLRNADA